MIFLIATAHILGTVIASIVVYALTLMFSNWHNKRSMEAAYQDASISLGIPVAKLEDAQHTQRVLAFAAARSSPELFRNRISDLCGLIQIGWTWLGFAIEVVFFLVIIWLSIFEDPGSAVYAWSIVGISIFFWICGMAFSLFCKLLTGRYPGQARGSRKHLAKASAI